ncbi:unnamed protein product [Didymodactylos carnosus]|uniref:Uncharacterized protein n=1 Tax=Didymodactylos carnosus TaxID=1234261 RepID=A0A814MXR8_9BILA|nr:unnamed protein product [Didymodactylos carnosus]CAF3849821.1 unnamed protein product [Didymodactylos carnosus]
MAVCATGEAERWKNINYYYSSFEKSKVLRSSWWLIMLDDITKSIKENMTKIFNTPLESFRLRNPHLLSLASKSDLMKFTNIRIVETTVERIFLEEFNKTQPVSVIDMLACFPSQSENYSNEFVERKRSINWWSFLFEQIDIAIKSDKKIEAMLKDKLVEKPIFLIRQAANNSINSQNSINKPLI